MLPLHFRAAYAAASTMKHMETYTYSGRYSCPVLVNSGVARQMVVKSQTSTFKNIHPVGVAFKQEDRQTNRSTDRHDEANARVS
jgi:hypothetical protein